LDLFVDTDGHDSATGTRADPFRTITAALAADRARGERARLWISIGTFDAAAGEHFPLA